MIRTMFALLPEDSTVAVRRLVAWSLFSVIARALAVVFLVPLIEGLVDGDHRRALSWLAALTAAFLLGWAADYAATRIGHELGFGVLNHAQRGVAERLSRIRLTWFSADNTAAARQAVAATGPDLVGVVIYLFTPIFGAVALPLAIGVALLFISWPVGLVALAGVPLLLGALWGTTAITARADRVLDSANSRLTERIVEFARTQQALRVARRAESERSLAGDALTAQHGATMRLLLLQIPGAILFGLVGQVVLFAMAGVIVWQMLDGATSQAAAIALIVVVVRYLEPFTTLGELASGLESVRLALRRIATVLDAETVGSGTQSPAIPDAPRIDFEGVGFDYGDPRHPVLENVNLTFEPGSTTAIIGASGSGKSTILSLIAGLHEPSAGRILFDGVDAATLDLPTRRALTSVVFQDPYLIQGSIEENIRAGAPETSDDAVAHASRLARVDEITGRLADGAASDVGEGGAVLSGGERQRVSIARALCKRAPVLLIDEATSALDNENERAVVDALADDSLSRTRVLVAHRQAGIRRADRVVVIDSGRVVESGTRDELLAAGGRFARFWDEQDAATRWRITERHG